jgi:hypothetical protein
MGSTIKDTRTLHRAAQRPGAPGTVIRSGCDVNAASPDGHVHAKVDAIVIRADVLCAFGHGGC